MTKIDPCLHIAGIPINERALSPKAALRFSGGPSLAPGQTDRVDISGRPQKGCTYLIRPRTRFGQEVTAKRFKVAIVDTMNQERLIPIARDKNHPEKAVVMPHGQFVRKWIELLAPDTEVVPFHRSEVLIKEHTKKALDEIRQQLRDGERFDAVNISLAFGYPMDFIQKALGQSGAKPEQLGLMREALLDKFRRMSHLPIINTKDNTSELLLEDVLCIDAISEIINRWKVPVFVSAGNGGINSLLLAQSVRGVGALALDGNKADFSSDNGLVTDWAQGETCVTPVYDKDRLRGFSLDDSGKVHVEVSETATSDGTLPDKLGLGESYLVQGSCLSSPSKTAAYINKLGSALDVTA